MKKVTEIEVEKVELEIEEEDLLAKKLEAARKVREAEQAVDAAEEAEEAEAPTPGTPEALVEEKDYLYGELEKMGCSRNYLVKMKERHGTVIVYPHEEGKWFVVRPLKVREMKMIREIAGQDAEKLNKEILEAACVFPKLTETDVYDLPAGLPDLLVNMISRLSAFIPVELAFSLSKEL
jgi:hypothetical protein